MGGLLGSSNGHMRESIGSEQQAIFGQLLSPTMKVNNALLSPTATYHTVS
jgi:hypothetical protein